MSREGNFRRHLVWVFFARRPRKNCARVPHEMAHFELQIAHLTISMEPTALLAKVSSYGLLPRLWVLLKELAHRWKMSWIPNCPNLNLDLVIIWKTITSLNKRKEFNVWNDFKPYYSQPLYRYRNDPHHRNDPRHRNDPQSPPKWSPPPKWYLFAIEMIPS